MAKEVSAHPKMGEITRRLLGVILSEYHTLPLKVDRYLSRTRHMSAAQHGAYLLLLMTAWKMDDNALPNDDDFLARCASMDKRTWLRNKSVVMEFWAIGPDSKWHQRTLDETRKYVAEVVSKKSAAGHASALKRKERYSTYVETHNQHNVQQINPNQKLNNGSDQNNGFGEKEVNGLKPKGILVTNDAIAKASAVARDNGFSGGDELGLELESIFLNWIKEKPRNPDAAFLKWVPGYVHNAKNH